MSAFNRLWSPRAGWFGTQLVNTAAMLGTGGTSISNNTTTSIILPVPGGLTTYSKCEVFLAALTVNGLVAGVVATGDMLATVYRRNNQGTPANVAMTGSKSLTSSIIATADKTYAFAITATDANAIFLSGDSCRIDVVTTDTVNTQPTVVISALWAIRRVA